MSHSNISLPPTTLPFRHPNLFPGKRNTSRAVFTSYERSLAKAAWNSTSARLSRDSFLPFASCRLCLIPARDPVSCSHGDIFCRECALSNILAQKKEIKRLEKAREREEKEAEEDRIREEDEARERAVQEFERIQMGLEAKVGGAGKKIVGREDGKILVEEDVTGSKRGEKRKFELDEDELLRIAREERTKARKAIDEEKVRPLPSRSHVSYINHITGFQNDPPFLLDPLHHAFLQHERALTHHLQKSQAIPHLPRLPRRQPSSLLTTYPNQRGLHRRRRRRNDQNAPAHLSLLQKSPQQHLQSYASQALRARPLQELRHEIHDPVRRA